MAAPHKQPKKLKQVKGTLRQDRLPKNELELPTVTGNPEPPAHLSEGAKQIFVHIYTTLKNRGVIADLDLYALGMLSFNADLVVQAEKELAHGMLITITNKGGHSYEIKSPWIDIRNKAEANYISMSAKFGLTPSDRAKISMPEPPKKNPLQDLMNK